MDQRNESPASAESKAEAARAAEAAAIEGKPEMAQHEMLDPRLPKKDVAAGLEDFDGDEA